MVSEGYRADPALVAEAERAFVEAARAFEEAPSEERARALLTEVGRLLVMDAPARVWAWREGRADGGRAVAEVIAGEDAAAIEDAALAIRSALDRRALGAGDLDLEGLAREVMPALRGRDEAELRWIAASEILGEAPAIDVTMESARMLFEQVIRPEIWRLGELDDRRRERLEAIAPRHRRAFWWWQEGAEIGAHAVSALPAVATLVARFPAAAEALAALVAAQRAWDEVGRARQRDARVISLGDFIARRARRAREALAGQRPGEVRLSLAAAGGEEEITLIDRADLQISWAPPHALILDLVAERAPGQAPSLELPGRAPLVMTPVEGALERWAIALDPAALAAKSTLVVPLAQSTLQIALPPEEP